MSCDTVLSDISDQDDPWLDEPEAPTFPCMAGESRSGLRIE
jgi:hypothetical protein